MPLHCAIVIHAIDGLGSISTNQGKLMRQQSAQQYTAQHARGRTRGIYSRKQQVANDVN